MFLFLLLEYELFYVMRKSHEIKFLHQFENILPELLHRALKKQKYIQTACLLHVQLKICMKH